ncbi:MAG: efflux RND transporter periplasmic adaptor subunit [Burkholderiales bacterium]|nr:efflux RND transporter periplasmic adaptor subunit [Burkholderiales bacterium]
MKKALTALFLLQCLLPCLLPAAQAAELSVASVRSSQGGLLYSADGVVEAVRQTVISAQVAGAVTALPVHAGDAVKAGALLLRIDARAARQEASAGRAQVEAARAALALAARDVERQKLLFARQYISQAQLDRAEAEFKSATASATAQIAQAGALQTQTDFYALNAPYAGLVADVAVTVGDMALPGRPLLTLYDPSALRVTATLPQALASGLAPARSARIEFPALPDARRWATAARLTVLPVADAATHTVQIRLDLPASVPGLTPGMFARVSLQLQGGGPAQAARLYVPARAVLRRAELSAVYVLNAQGRPLLRQVRLGAPAGSEQEILSGVAAGEQVALDPAAAAKRPQSR